MLLEETKSQLVIWMNTMLAANTMLTANIPFLLSLECLYEWLSVGFDVIPLVPFSRCGSIGEWPGTTELDTVYENQL